MIGSIFFPEKIRNEINLEFIASVILPSRYKV